VYFLLLIGVGGILTVFSLNLFGHVRFLVPSSMTCTFIPPSLFYKPTITLPLAHLSYFAISESRTGSRYWIPRPRLYEFTCHLHSIESAHPSSESVEFLLIRVEIIRTYSSSCPQFYCSHFHPFFFILRARYLSYSCISSFLRHPKSRTGFGNPPSSQKSQLRHTPSSKSTCAHHRVTRSQGISIH